MSVPSKRLSVDLNYPFFLDSFSWDRYDVGADSNGSVVRASVAVSLVAAACVSPVLRVLSSLAHLFL